MAPVPRGHRLHSQQDGLGSPLCGRVMDPHHVGAGWAQASKGTACCGDGASGAMVASRSLIQRCILLANTSVPSSAFSVSSGNDISFYAHVYSLSTSFGKQFKCCINTQLVEPD